MTWTARRGPALCLALFLLIALLWPPVPVQAQTINKIGYTNSQNGSNLRAAATTASAILATLPTGSKVEVFEKVTGLNVSGSNEWYRVRYIQKNLNGYIHAPLVTLSSVPVNPSQPTGDSDFVQYLAAQGFPESYWPALRLLHSVHDNWVFQAHHVKDEDNLSKTLTFQKALDKQLAPSVPARSLVNSSSLLSHRTYEKPGYDYRTDTWTVYDAGGWMRASRPIVAYYLDPRNFLDEGGIFQFEQLSYNAAVHSLDVLQVAAQGTFLGEGDTFNFTDLDGNSRTNQTYADIFLYAGQVSGVNPFFLMQRCLTEVGGGGSDSTSGQTNDYSGYYNFFNIGAYSSVESPITNGLRYAKYGKAAEGKVEPSPEEKEKYLLPWDHPWKAIVGGAKWIAGGYIVDSRGNPLQDTSYSQKFHLDGAIYGTYWHQYMGNIVAPANESGKVFAMYLQRGLLDKPFVFKIPVLSGLPDTVSPYPTDDRSQNNWLKSLTLSKGSLSPAFNPETYSYTATVDESVSQITLNAAAYHSKCTVKNTGTKSLTKGLNTFKIEAVSESGHKRTYTLKITRQGPPPPPLTVTPRDSYVIQGNYLSNAWPGDNRNTAGRLLAGLSLSKDYTAKAFDASGNLAASDTPLGTGARIDFFYKNDTSPARSLQLLIYGDPNGDGRINSIDLSYVIDSMYKGKRWKDVQNLALDANRDGKVNSIDLSYIIDSMYKGKAINQY